MKTSLAAFLSLTAMLFLTMAVDAGAAKKQANPPTLRFSGYLWDVRQAGTGGPGPNLWDPANAWVDAQGRLHLKLSHGKDGWQCVEVSTRQKFGMGRYQFQISSPLDHLDPNIVLGLFDYPTPDVGPDGTNEIDIEFSRWGDPKHPMDNDTVFPAQAGLPSATQAFPMPPGIVDTTHRFVRQPGQIGFQSLRGLRNDDVGEFAHWTFRPADPEKRVPQKALPIHLNLWLMQGKPPQDGQEVEIIIRQFSFQPEKHSRGHR